MRQDSAALLNRLFIVLLFASASITVKPIHASGNLNALLGFKAMEKDDWDPVHEHGEGGLLLDFKGDDWPISVALDFLGSYSEETGTFFVPGRGLVDGDWEARTSEFNAGVRKYWGKNSTMRPYIGGGLAFISARLEAKTGRFDYVRDSDYGAGLWFNGGVVWSLTKHFNLGFDIRLSQADVTIFDVKRKAGGFHAGLILGYRW